MDKRFLLASLLVLSTVALCAFEKIPEEYLIHYGSPTAPVQVIEYVSLSCPKCVELFRKDFKNIQKQYIDSKKVYWTFHIHPADILSLQAMVCVENLTPEDKRVFWEVLLDTLDDPTEGASIMQLEMEELGSPSPMLKDLLYLATTTSFECAYKYLKQEKVIKELPTVEINGHLYDAFPSYKFLKKQFDTILTEGK